MAYRVVVTGASSGIGEATARRFAAHGWDVIGVARRAERLDALAAEGVLTPIVADITVEEDVARVRAEVEAGGPLHALVNNAGGALGTESVEDAIPDDWRAMYEVNVIGTQRMIAALLPALRTGSVERGSGDIVAVTSIAGHTVYLGGGGYNAAKHAQHALMAVLRLELGGEPLRVVEIAPGMVKTDFSLVRYRGDQEAADAVYAGVENPLRPEDIAEAIVHAVELPSHVDLDLVVVKPVAQSAVRTIHKGALAPKA
ncbi:SDR family NAD(P)-dependent oxidoreductase [Protaetiibacter sp. SSC-01]|uniref:SDR family NAD(P)-dependent oxidoreductase n=1 Tax=Protaetiibacter sp. SSC-01 TaxID=2759943 RepID=UPI001656B10E|nr:SDR family NAD(P)-dependent oxidoreductase [Protaetiibacter sp. SSC-01]QNO38481.1 SDR family NAD(P)-dependent oxidoreductase [Protaetiibacter sp. SSC-01]